MIRLFYLLLVTLVSRLSWLFSKFGTRSNAFFEGRRGLKEKYLEFNRAAAGRQVCWMHCSSLGEFEQGRPVLEAIRESFPEVRILLTFFSPSGYEVRKNYSHADAILYLPLDTPANARWVVDAVSPSMVILVKYDFWPILINELHKRDVPVIAISAIFRRGQLYFKWYGSFFRKALTQISHFFLQDEDSIQLLSGIGIKNVTLAGDSRFDRVTTIAKQAPKWDAVERFLGGKPCWVAGSAWAEDIRVMAPFIQEHTGAFKFIIVPHEVDPQTISELEQLIGIPSVRWSTLDTEETPWKKSVLIIDTIGMLSGLYRYARYAWIGGAFGKGLHNILEAAVFGIPVFFGNYSYERFREAKLLLQRGGAFAVFDSTELEAKFNVLEMDAGTYDAAADASGKFVNENQGATRLVMDYILPEWKR